MTKENSLLFHRQGCFTFRYASIHSYALMDQIMDLLVTAQRRRVVVKIYQPHFLPFFDSAKTAHKTADFPGRVEECISHLYG